NLGRIAHQEGQPAAGRRDIADINARVAAKLGRDLVFLSLQPLLQRVLRIGFEQQVAAAGQVEAEVDLVLREPLRPGACIRRSGDQARDRQENADRDDDPNQPHLPTRELKHRSGPQSFAGVVFGVSTWLMVDLMTRIFTPCAISTSASSSLTLVTRPRMPPPVMTSSPFLTALIAAWCCFTRCCCGRIIRK